MSNITFAIGDIHGFNHLLIDLLGQIDSFVEKHGIKSATLVTLGDYVDRGPDSKGVLDTLIALPLKNREVFKKVVHLKGNHEDMMILGSNGDVGMMEMFWYNGGDKTIASFGIQKQSFYDNPFGHVNAIIMKYRDFFDGLVLSYEDSRRFYVHAGVNPRYALKDQRSKDMLWIRDDFLIYPERFEKYIVHGHTPGHEAHVLENRVNLDSGSFFTGMLSCGVFNDTQDMPIDILVSIDKDIAESRKNTIAAWG